MSALQIAPFMQNKAKFRKVKLNVNNVLTKDYDQLDTWSIRKTKPIQSQFKPNQSQFKPKFKKAKMNVTSFLTKNYEQLTMNNELINTNPTYRGVASGEAGSEAKNDHGGDQQKDLANKG